VRDDEKYQRRHMWIRTWGTETGLNGQPHEDYSCIVEGEIVGRISAQYAGPTKGTFKWDGGHSRRIRAKVLPQGGYAPDVHEAARKVEDHYDLLRQEAGLPPVGFTRYEASASR